ncbi:MAG TPA: phosphotransferase [Paludibacter sp.]|nr:phosphotransferase [Paludibacter sp.]
MRYYYFNPVSKQYFFPDGFNKYPVFATFYKPYRFITKAIWKLWRTSHFFRNLFHTDEIGKYIPIENIQEHLPGDSIMAFHIGGAGSRNKINVLSVDAHTREIHFTKYATTPEVSISVLNEGFILEQLKHLPFVPQLQLHAGENDSCAFIRTTVFEGRKMKYVPGDKQVTNILETLSGQNIKCRINYRSGLKTCFAHGDFCPWNMFYCNKVVKIFDWEMAGMYPLGYDLFTYIFQYEFLVNRRWRFDEILEENNAFFQEYFSYHGVVDWLPFLREFTEIRYKLESEKRTESLVKAYRKLKEHINKGQPLNKQMPGNGNY